MLVPNFFCKPKMPAAQAGLRGLRRTESRIIKIRDIIIAIEDVSIENEGDLFRSIKSFEPGDLVTVTVDQPEIKAGDDERPEIKLKEINFTLKLIASDDSTFLKR
jgi:S1-C subfamily serine protease